MSDKKSINVLMVTGVYYPELNGANLQCKRIISDLKLKVSFLVLTATRDTKIALIDSVGGIKVKRVLLRNSKFSLILHAINTSIFILKHRNEFDIVHLHGYSLRSILVIFWAKLLNKKIIIKMTCVGHDDPSSVYRRGKIINYFYLLADIYIGISPAFYSIYSHMGLTHNKYRQIPNGVDTKEFSPVKDNQEKIKLRSKLGLPKDINLILFIGHFSSRKSPDHLLKAWFKLLDSSAPKTGIVFIGRTDYGSFEIDKNVIDFVKSTTTKYQEKLIFFRENIYPIDEYYKASDIFVLSSSSEGFPNALLEAMSCGLPVISTRIEGITDWIIENNVNGLLYEYGDIDRLCLLLENLLNDIPLRNNIGFNARKTIQSRLDISITAMQIYKLYKESLI
jgi:glycosyltransferase involved in cell wall biosynthesis